MSAVQASESEIDYGVCPKCEVYACRPMVWSSWARVLHCLGCMKKVTECWC